MIPSSKQKLYYAVITLASLVGFVASFLQMLEKLTLMKNVDAVLVCNLNSVFSCTNILNAPQSSVFGFPNSLLCIIFFGFTLTAGLIGWTGGVITAKMRLVFQAMAVFFLGFGLWYFWESIFNVGSLCIYCLFCYLGVLFINGAFHRLNYPDYTHNPAIQKLLEQIKTKGIDIFILSLIGLVIILEAIIKFL